VSDAAALPSLIQNQSDLLNRLARLENIAMTASVPDGAIQIVYGDMVLAIPLADVINIEAETARLQKEISKLDGEIKKLSGKLSNEGFVSKAPQAVIEENKARLASDEGKREKLQAALARLA
jgi:valyl-tRNA synthetase